MLSSVSYVCLGKCAGMWVISGGINWDGQVLSFISVLLFQLSGYFCLFWTFYCGFFSCFYFADVFGSSMWSDLRAAVPQGSGVLHSRMLRWLAEHQYFQVFLFLQQMEVLGPRAWLDSFSCISVSLCDLFASFNG